MYYITWLHPLLAIIGAMMLAASGYAVAMPAELSSLNPKDLSSAGYQHPIEAAARGENDVPIFVCSWKPFPDSPEKHMYQLFGYAKKAMKDSTHAEWHVDNHGSAIADIGMIPLNRGILRFRAPCPQHRSDGWGWTDEMTCLGQNWAYCTGTPDANASKVDCFWANAGDDCTWPDVFSAAKAPDLLSVFSQIALAPPAVNVLRSKDQQQ